ncbi:MAG TPA: HAD family phosphatase [Bacteroidales bacterium]|nr:HAD family phosphatase [Bacteroidales bacterium]
MIKNIVFDLGNVLISFRPAEYFDKKQYPGELKSQILNDVFASAEWRLLDNGDITLREAIDAIALKSSLKRGEIARIFDLRTDLIFPLAGNVKMLPEFKKRGFRLYYLSNFPLDIFDEVRDSYSFFSYFDGGLISAEARSSKPDPGIYRIFFERHSLLPEECLFIDDIKANVRAAEAFGTKGIVADGSDSISGMVKMALMRYGAEAGNVDR